jgi:uncharacterized protein
MLASPIVQRTNTSRLRAAGTFIVVVLAANTAVSSVFLLLDAPIPQWFLVVGRWLPALVTLIVLRGWRLQGGILQWWNVRPGGWRRLITGSVAGVLVLLAVYTVTALLASLLGVATLLGPAELTAIAVILPVMVVVFALSTFGEEAAWRGFLQQTLAPWGFWRSSAAVALVWVAFHIPLHGVMALQGVLPWAAAIASTVLLFPLGILLSALVERWGSVWPAVFAHALPMTALNLLANPGSFGLATQLSVTAISSALMLGAAAIIRRGRTGRSPGGHSASQDTAPAALR